MKKVDLHVHTIATAVDADFEFDLAKLKEYVTAMSLDGIAITNHNTFDRAQFESITHTLDIEVLPGIEINLGKGHALLISDKGDLDDFTGKCDRVSQIVKVASDSISVQQLREIYGDLSSVKVKSS
jgi:predicted metal-dependent phosphoesterase TrpH